MGDWHIPHHLDLERVLPGLEPGLAEQVHVMVASGFEVIDAWGPVQMAVCGLVLKRESLEVVFDSERNKTAVRISHHEYAVNHLDATLAWARTPDASGSEPVPGYYPGGYCLVGLDRPWAANEAVMRSDNQYLAQVCEWFSTHDHRLTQWTSSARAQKWEYRRPGVSPEQLHAEAARRFSREWPKFLASLEDPPVG